MEIQWSVVATIAAPVLALFVGAALDRFLERRPRLIAYFAHTSAFRVAGATPIQIHTHGIVVRNTGKRPAQNVRVSHYVLPDFNVFPDVPFQVENLPAGGRDIVFPTLVPGQQISISYLYFPPLLFNQIHSGIRHNDGFATEVSVLPTPQYSAWVLRVLRTLVVLGIIAASYILYVCIRAVIRII
jgi:hypothetical protein